jgi:hypothetical protein
VKILNTTNENRVADGFINISQIQKTVDTELSYMGIFMINVHYFNTGNNPMNELNESYNLNMGPAPYKKYSSKRIGLVHSTEQRGQMSNIFSTQNQPIQPSPSPHTENSPSIPTPNIPNIRRNVPRIRMAM